MKNIVAIVMVLMSFFVRVELDAMSEGDLFATPEKKPRAQLISISPQKINRAQEEENSIKKISGRRLWDKEYDSSEGEEFEDDGKEDNYSDCRNKSPRDEQVDEGYYEFCCSLCQGCVEITLDCGHGYCETCASSSLSFDGQGCPACSDFTS